MQLLYTNEADFRQERDFSQKITATFEFIRAHWRPLGRVLLYLVVPLALVRAILGGLLQSQLLDSLRTTGGQGRVFSRTQTMGRVYGEMFNTPTYYITLALSILFSAVLILSVYGYLLGCLEGQPPSVGQVWGVVRRRLVGTALSLVGVGFIIGLSSLVLLLPGIYMMVALSIFFIVYLAENTGFGSTLNRCISLTKGKWWSTAGLIFIMLVLLYALTLGFSIAWGSLLGLLRGVLPTFAVGTPLFSIVFTALTSLLALALYPPLLIVLAFQYFNLVERKEGLGMYQLVNQLGQAAPAGPGTDAYRPIEEGEY